MRARRWTTLTAFAVAVVLTLAGCTGGRSAVGPDAVIDLGSLYEPSNLSNVDAGGQGVTEAFSGNVYESLLRLNDNGSISKLLAKEYTASPDGLTYTFILRDGVKFHSGRNLVAADVKASFERVIGESSQFARKSSYQVVEKVDVPDEHTIVFHLSSRSISFPYLLSYVWVVNPELTDPKNRADGTGPYRFEAWRRGSTLSIVRNDDYWGERAKNAGATFHYFTDSSAQTSALLSKQVDLIVNIQSPDALSLFEKRSGFQISEGTSTTKELLAFNDRVAPFDNVLVRRAVYSAINREKLLDAVWGGRGKVIGSMVPPTDPWFEDLVHLNPYDPALSKHLLEEAGLPGGFEFTLLTPSYDPHLTVAEFLKSELSKIGVAVSIKVITADEWYTQVFRERRFQATLQEHVNDRDVVWYANPDFYWGYNNDEVQRLVKQAEATATADEQIELLKNANRIIAGQAASAWLFLYPQIVVAREGISGFPVNGLNSQFYVFNITKQ